MPMRRPKPDRSRANPPDKWLVAGLIALLASLLFGMPLDGTAGVVAVVVLTGVALFFFVLSVRSAHRAQE